MYQANNEIYTYLHTLSLHDALPIEEARPAPRRGGKRLETRRTFERRIVGMPAGDGNTPEFPGIACVMPGNERRWRGVGEIVALRSEEHTSELQSLMRTSFAVFCLKKKNLYSTTDLFTHGPLA